MLHKGKIPAVEKIQSVEDYLSGKIGRSDTIRLASVDEKTIQRWGCRYKTDGPAGLLLQERNRSYSKETKLAAVQDETGENDISETGRDAHLIGNNRSGNARWPYSSLATI